MSTSGAGRPYHHGELAERLIEAGIGLLRDGGIEALSLRAVARRAGVSAMAPYRHFADKQALLAAIAATGFRRLKALLEQADTRDKPLIAQGIAYVEFACAEPAIFRLMFRAMEPGGYPDLRDAGDTAYRVLERRVGAMVPADRRDVCALACWSMVHGLASLLVDGCLPAYAADAPGLAATVSQILQRAIEAEARR